VNLFLILNFVVLNNESGGASREPILLAHVPRLLTRLGGRFEVKTESTLKEQFACLPEWKRNFIE